MRLIGLNEVKKRVFLSESSIWRRRQKGMFPPPVDLFSKKNAWREDNIEEFTRSRRRRDR